MGEGDASGDRRRAVRPGVWAALLVALALGAVQLIRGLPAPIEATREVVDRVVEEAAPLRRGPANLLIVSIDSLRAGHLGSFGYERDTSPRIDELAAEGVRFHTAVSTASWTLPSHASLLTGLHPVALDVRRSNSAIAPSRELLSEVLSTAGYRTGAVVCTPLLDPIYGFDQGWDRYDHETIGELLHGKIHEGSTAEVVTDTALAWIDSVGDERFFAFAHYWDVHYDYDPPPPYDTRFDPHYEGDIDSSLFMHNPAIHIGMNTRDLDHVVALYDGEIAATDRAIGRLLDGLRARGLYEDTLIVLVADHGEAFFEHDAKGHKATLYEEEVRIPFLLKLPGGAHAGSELESLVGITDVFPTVLDVLGLAAGSELDGRSVLPLLEGAEPAGERIRHMDLEGRVTAVRGQRYKLYTVIGPDGPHESLFDLQTDPGEQVDVLARRPEVATRLRAEADRFLADAEERSAAHEKAYADLEPQMERSLRALGYIE